VPQNFESSQMRATGAAVHAEAMLPQAPILTDSSTGRKDLSAGSSSVAKWGEERAAVGVALGLLDLEHGLDVGAREVLLAHERRDKVRVLLALQRAEHGHERKLVVEVAMYAALSCALSAFTSRVRGIVAMGAVAVPAAGMGLT
jgi:hypothetical protein